jgi:flagellar biogenesis protein FliO
VDFHSTISDLANISQIVATIGGGIWLVKKLLRSEYLAIQKKIQIPEF